jgi:hypothetical protein
MRLTAALFLALLTLPAAAETYRAQPGDGIAATEAGLVLSAADGSGSLELPFGTPFHVAMPPLAVIAGHDLHVAFPEECPAGPVVSVTLPGRLDLVFQEDRLAGWFLGPDDAVATGAGLAIGTPRAAMPAVEWYDDSTLGEEFTLGAIAGLMSEDGAAVSHLWSGIACIFR